MVWDAVTQKIRLDFLSGQKLPDGIADGYAMSDVLLYKANVFITPGGIFGSAGSNYIRVSLCAPEEKILECFNRINAAGIVKLKHHV